MIHQNPSSCERIRSPQSARIAAWMMMGLFVSGCSSLATSLRDTDADKHQYAVDLKADDDELSSNGDWKSSEEISTAQADYSSLRSRNVSQPDEGRTTPGGFTAGHSFASRKATLRQPVPMLETETSGSDTQGETNQKPEVPDAVNPEASMMDSKSTGVTPGGSAPREVDDSFWSSGGGVSAWRPNGNDETQRSQNRSRTSQKSPSSSKTDSILNSDANSTRRSDRQLTDMSRELPSDFSSPPSNPGSPPSLSRRPGNLSIGNGKPPATDDLAEGMTAGQELLNGSAGSDDAAPTTEADSEAGAATPPPAEPGVLERLRGLYAPRPTDTDKFRKQMRRLSDPFGLLKERDEEAGPTTPIDPGSNEQTAETPEPASPTAEDVEKGVDVRKLLDVAIAQAETDLETWPRTPSGRPDRTADWRRRQTDLRLMYLVAGRSADSVRIIESLPEEEQEFWQSLMLAMHSYRTDEQDKETEESLVETLEHLRTAEKRLQPLARLKIRRAVFCERIDGFGQVAEFPASDFDPGQRVLIYVDVRNFRTELTASGRYRSEFEAAIDYLREGNDEVVETMRLPQILDECDVERTDYYQSFELTIPALAGRYVARVRLRDLLNLQTTEVELPFTVRSQQAGL